MKQWKLDDNEVGHPHKIIFRIRRLALSGIIANTLLLSLSVPDFTMPETNPNPNPFVSLLQNFRIPFPFLFTADQKSDSQGQNPLPSDKTDVVKFADTIPVVPPPLKIETEESAQSSAVVWQVCM